MSSLDEAIQEAQARSLSIENDTLVVNLVDGRTVIVPLRWFARLWHGSQDERENFEIIGDGTYIHWPDLDEDLTVAGLLAGRRSGEGSASLKKWLASRKSNTSKKAASGKRAAAR